MVKTSLHPLRLFINRETKPLVSNEAARWAAFASAVGETKLALTAILETPETEQNEGEGEVTTATEQSRGARAKCTVRGAIANQTKVVHAALSLHFSRPSLDSERNAVNPHPSHSMVVPFTADYVRTARVSYSRV